MQHGQDNDSGGVLARHLMSRNLKKDRHSIKSSARIRVLQQDQALPMRHKALV